jgi:hypothetical protein
MAIEMYSRIQQRTRSLKGCVYRLASIATVVLRLPASLLAVVMVATVWMAPPVAQASSPPRIENSSPAPSGCMAGQLRATAQWGAATEALVGGVTLTNHSTAACVLRGYPTVRLLDRFGSLVPTAFHRARAQKMNTRGTSLTDRRAGIVRPGAKAYVSITWTQWCAGKIERSLSLAVRLPGSAGTVRARVDDLLGRRKWASPPPCDARGPSRLYAGPFQLVS